MVEKKKTTKTKKKVDKKKIKKQLKKKQKQMPKKDFKKLAKKVKSKLEDKTKGGQALENIATRLRQNVPPLPIFNPQIAAKQTKERLESETKKEFAKPIQDFKNMKKKYEEVLMKYNNGELSATDLFELYAETKQFANTANEYLPSRNEISNAYKTLKSKLTYFRNFINSNRPSGQNPLQETIIATVRQTGPQPPPPTPPPSSNNSPPPPPNNSPDPPPTQQQPTAVPTPSPTISNIVNAITPEASPQNLAIAGLATLGSGAALLNRMAIMRNQGQLERLQGENILNRGRNLAEAGLGQAIGNQLQQAAENTLQNLRNAQQTLENIENRQRQTASAERTLNPRRERPPLRQSTIDRQARARINRPTDEFLRQSQLEQDMGLGMTPLNREDIRQEMEFERDMAGDLRPVRDESVEARLNEQRQLQNLANTLEQLPTEEQMRAGRADAEADRVLERFRAEQATNPEAQIRIV